MNEKDKRNLKYEAPTVTRVDKDMKCDSDEDEFDFLMRASFERNEV